MYAQVTNIRVPMDAMPRMRQIIEYDYLPAVRSRPGFVTAYLLEQADDPDAAQLVVLWESHEAVEEFNRTGLLESSVQALAVRMPGVRVQRQGYLVRIAPELARAQVAAVG